ncbi:Phage integrase family protein [Solimonas aquatica]|uniref:Phage integrase family protein n=1 Tax=Solimonas aquatica TaxID=489703 RepID=A0A1H9DXU2_9GAMM|nr:MULTISPECIES: tyrosine-type recombinase/integrase [Solimonas]SEQ18281.1 Phage integrase family protein [Solimonas aquatica]
MAIHKRKRKSGARYTAVIRVVGQPTESQTFDSLKQAERWHNSRLEQIANGSKVLESRARTATLNDILPRYAEQVAAHRGKTVACGVSELAALGRLSESFLGEMRVVAIDASHVETWLDQFRKMEKPGGGRYKESSIRRSLDTFAAVLNFAATDLGLHRFQNPCRFISPSKRPKGADPRERNLREGEFEEFERQLALFQGGCFADTYRFLLFSGMRRTEAFLLQESWVNWEDCTIAFPITKTGAETRALAPPAMALLRRLKVGEDGRYFKFLPDRVTKVNAILSRRTSIMIAARRLDGGRFAGAIQLFLLLPRLKNIEELLTLRADATDWGACVIKFDNPRGTTLRRRRVSYEALELVRILTRPDQKSLFDFTADELKAAMEKCQWHARSIGTFSPHILRAAFTTALLEGGVPQAVVGKFTGHRDARSIQRYTRVTSPKAAKMFGAMAKKGLDALLGKEMQTVVS